jgi:hypothetical protein
VIVHRNQPVRPPTMRQFDADSYEDMHAEAGAPRNTACMYKLLLTDMLAATRTKP